MKILIPVCAFLFSLSSIAAGLPGVKSKTYVGKNANNGDCKVVVTSNEVELWTSIEGRTYRDFPRRSFEYDQEAQEYVFVDYYIGQIETIVRLDQSGNLSEVVFNEGGYGGVREESCQITK